jgi:hypothetical protein
VFEVLVNSSSFSGRRIVASTFQPLFEKYVAAALPIPDDVPVIKTVLLISFYLFSSVKVYKKSSSDFPEKFKFLF